MTLVNAVLAFFDRSTPAGVDFTQAFALAKGKKDTDLTPQDVATLDAIADVFQDFCSDPAVWLATASSSDPRRSWWEKLALALGATVSTGSEGSRSTSQGGSGAAPPQGDPEPTGGIDPDAMVNASRRVPSSGTGGGKSRVVVGNGEDDPPKRERSPRSERAPERDQPPKPPEPPKPLFVPSRDVPPEAVEVLKSAPYKRWRDLIIAAYTMRGSSDQATKTRVEAEIMEIPSLLRSLEKSRELFAPRAAVQLRRMAEALQAGRHQSETAWFQANFVTGTYAD